MTPQTGWQLKIDALEQVNAATDAWWRDCADRGIAELAARGHTWQAADLLEVGVPEPWHPNAWGGRLHAAAAAGVIECVGFAPSKRATTKASIVRLWRGCAR